MVRAVGRGRPALTLAVESAGRSHPAWLRYTFMPRRVRGVRARHSALAGSAVRPGGCRRTRWRGHPAPRGRTGWRALAVAAQNALQAARPQLLLCVRLTRRKWYTAAAAVHSNTRPRAYPLSSMHVRLIVAWSSLDTGKRPTGLPAPCMASVASIVLQHWRKEMTPGVVDRHAHLIWSECRCIWCRRARRSSH